ncbi:hypothetical protein F2P81_017895 [Scophthalmus maximus]|uniref:Uncharacterized protein n=1 Tax=Scophthalmus maximus TaxID=52904 RepID=A0A6A4SAT4_SCOMX|nr:hypothetical protein F2P81_017895 [Scophthalmus maximus]
MLSSYSNIIHVLRGKEENPHPGENPRGVESVRLEFTTVSVTNAAIMRCPTLESVWFVELLNVISVAADLPLRKQLHKILSYVEAAML